MTGVSEMQGCEEPDGHLRVEAELLLGQHLQARGLERGDHPQGDELIDQLLLEAAHSLAELH